MCVSFYWGVSACTQDRACFPVSLAPSPPPPHRLWKEVDEVSLLFFLGTACFAYQRHGHFFYCHTSLQYQVFLQKTERDREAAEGQGRLMCFWESEHTKQMGLPEFVS